MEFVSIIFTTLGSLISMFLLTKLMGQRQVSQMSMFDYVNGITIGSIAAEFATSLGGDFLKPLIAMIIYALAALAIAIGSCKSMALRKFFNGKPLVLFENGKIYEKNLSAAKMDINEFLTQCRVGGYFDLNEIESAMLETSGQISFLPKSQNRPATPEDLNLDTDPVSTWYDLVMDGQLMPDHLKASGKDRTWLDSQLARADIGQMSEAFYAACDKDGNFFACRGK